MDGGLRRGPETRPDSRFGQVERRRGRVPQATQFSVFFGNVNLDSTTQVSGHGIKFVNFGLSADVTY